ncbi:MAG: V-type ATPase 116kDa subunit family protein, partial [archaeon]|nr:V-type ATPase 116kDa subunit family protein [archaeon]
YSSLEKALVTEFKDKIHIECEEASEEDGLTPPTELINPKIVDSFEVFIDLYSKPTYKEIDPTNFIFLTFPLFFGFILGDVGYGFITLALFGFLKTKMRSETGRGLMNALILASLATIVFGFVFGEFFGVEPYHPLIPRAHNINMMLGISLVVGIVHINLGYLLGLINEYRKGGIGYMVQHTGSWVFFELAAILVILQYLDMLTFAYSNYIVYGVLVASIALLYKGHGIIGIIELPAILSNILSYARLFAVGLASVALAMVINDFTGVFLYAGGFGYVAGTITLVLGHTINILLGILGGFLQSLRLHYVEFFTKFYKGGGEAYLPFGKE